MWSDMYVSDMLWIRMCIDGYVWRERWLLYICMYICVHVHRKKCIC